jgi:hypothetical protein
MSDAIKDNYIAWFDYLDDLRSSGATNMFGASPYLMKEFGLSRDVARKVVLSWMNTFDGKTDIEARVQQALDAKASQ